MNKLMVEQRGQTEDNEDKRDRINKIFRRTVQRRRKFDKILTLRVPNAELFIMTHVCLYLTKEHTIYKSIIRCITFGNRIL